MVRPTALLATLVAGALLLGSAFAALDCSQLPGCTACQQVNVSLPAGHGGRMLLRHGGPGGFGGFAGRPAGFNGSAPRFNGSQPRFPDGDGFNGTKPLRPGGHDGAPLNSSGPAKAPLFNLANQTDAAALASAVSSQAHTFMGRITSLFRGRALAQQMGGGMRAGPRPMMM